ncbi:MAG: hypothetical protein JWR72_2017 [Flavisolibacter sp.]|nr:hypothetical protein [Flavisolibacter sp.]
MRWVLKKISSNSVHVLVLLAVLQVLCATYFLTIPRFGAVNSLLFLCCGIGSSFCILYLPPFTFKKAIIINKQALLKLLSIAALLPLSYSVAKNILDNTPLRIEYADMLPIIGVMCHRFLNGQFNQIYQPIPEIWNGIQPIYLPALWLPFCTSALFHFDMRWVTVGGIWLSIILCILPAWKRNSITLFYVLALLVLLAWLHLDQTHNVIRLSEEGVVFFYYSLMVVAIISGNALFIGGTAALCLLSRYAIIGWLPFAAIYLLYNRQYKFLMKTLAAGTLVAALLIMPFGTKFLSFQLQLPHQYIAHAKRVWKETPEHFYQSLGMAKIFGPSHVQLLHTILVWGTFIVPILFFMFLRKKGFSTINFLLAGFQLSLSFFYNFLDVSYLYLFYTLVFVSLVIAGWSLTCSYKRIG